MRNGGHFSGNLGVVELTVALHYVFDFEQDKLVWDVGHQAYIHKLLTGRKELFSSIRKYKGLSGFPKISESNWDHFGTGHSSTSISAVMGMAAAAELKQIDRQHIAVIGDGSLTGGMAFEALNNLGASNANVLIIVNDNQIGIDPNPGAVNAHLNVINPENNVFTALDLSYTGPIDGHDVIALVKELEWQKCRNIPRVLHIKTLKGKGYEQAELEQTKWHSVKYVKIVSHTEQAEGEKFPDVFGKELLKLAKADERIVAITPAMPSGSSLNAMLEQMPQRVFDVGIAEQHAVTFAAGLALEGIRPFCVIYSSFLQRAYDQIIHDVALQNIPVVFCLDRAGLVGEDGATHHGVFDLAYMSGIPNMTIISPMDAAQLKSSMKWAVKYIQGPVAIRYPKSAAIKGDDSNIELGKGRCLIKGNKIAILSIGEIGTEVSEAIKLAGAVGKVAHYDLVFAKPLDTELIRQVFNTFNSVITLEEGCFIGGIGERIASLAIDMRFKGKLIHKALPDQFIEHGSVQELRVEIGIDAKSLSELISVL